MIDPSNALYSFQEELSRGTIPLLRGNIYSDIYVFGDFPGGKVRLTYVTVENSTVTSLVSFVQHIPVEGKPCFQIGYAVPEPYRNQGRAKKTVAMALAEIRNGYKNYGAFYVEAIVGADNMASQRVAEQTISANPTPMTDKTTNLPAFQYLLKIG